MKTLTSGARRTAVLTAALAVAGSSFFLAPVAEAATPSSVSITNPTTAGSGAGVVVNASGASDSVVVNGSGFSGGQVFVAQCLESFDPLTGAPDQCNEGSYVSTSGSTFSVTIAMNKTFNTWNPHPWGTGSTPVDCTVDDCKIIAADHSTSPVQWGYADITWN